MNMKKSAFTMIELIMAIVVLGILAALALPRMERDLQQEAADNILSAIRYTQHLALTDNKTNPDSPTWQSSFWQIRFSNFGGEWQYTVASNMLGNNLAQNEAAIELHTGKYMYAGAATPGVNDSPEVFITNKYGVNGVVLNGCAGTSASNANHIAFDYLGRPHRGVTVGGGNDFATLINSNNAVNNCTITLSFTNSSENFVINILTETGYAFIQGQPNS